MQVSSGSELGRGLEQRGRAAASAPAPANTDRQAQWQQQLRQRTPCTCPARATSRTSARAGWLRSASSSVSALASGGSAPALWVLIGGKTAAAGPPSEWLAGGEAGHAQRGPASAGRQQRPHTHRTDWLPSASFHRCGACKGTGGRPELSAGKRAARASGASQALAALLPARLRLPPAGGHGSAAAAPSRC